jgi:hypothetical protein
VTGSDESFGSVLAALAANATIALAKGVAAAWALLAAIGMFVSGGAVSIWDGSRALIHPPELEAFWIGAAVLLIALLLDGL